MVDRYKIDPGIACVQRYKMGHEGDINYVDQKEHGCSDQYKGCDRCLEGGQKYYLGLNVTRKKPGCFLGIIREDIYR